MCDETLVTAVDTCELVDYLGYQPVRICGHVSVCPVQSWTVLNTEVNDSIDLEYLSGTPLHLYQAIFQLDFPVSEFCVSSLGVRPRSTVCRIHERAMVDASSP